MTAGRRLLRLDRAAVSRRVAGLLLTLTGASALFSPAALAAPLPPAEDPFYVAPATLADVKPGTILRTREVEVNLGPAPVTAAAFSAHQLLYRTNDARNEPVSTVTTLLVPDEPAPAGGRTILSLQDAEDSLDSICAPSYQLQIGQKDNKNVGIELASVMNQLAKGRVIVIPDHDGPESQYIVTGMEGHATLDSLRAVEQFPAAQVNGTATPIGLVGYSGGAHATAAANELHPAYAPELNIVGVAAGGVPVGNQDTIDYLDGSIGASLLIGTGIALDRAFPELDLESLLNEKGKALARKVEKGCATSVFAAPFAHFDDFTNVPDVNQIPRVKKIIEANALGHAAPTAPTFYYNAIYDELVWIKPLDDLVAKYCADGATLSYFRDPSGAEHIQATGTFVALATAYLEDRFAGKAPIPNSCGPVTAKQESPKGSNPGKSRRSNRVITVHPRIPNRIRVNRVDVIIGGKIWKTYRKRTKAIRISMVGRRCGYIRVDLRTTGRRHGRKVIAHDRRGYHLCQPGQRT